MNADQQDEGHDPRRERERQRRPAGERRRQDRDGDRADERQERDERQDREGADVDHRWTSSRNEPAMTIRPDGDAQGVVLDPPGLDESQAAAGLERGASERVDGPVDDLAIEPPHRVRDLAADDDEQQVVQLIEPPLVERGAIEERRPRGEVA